MHKSQTSSGISSRSWFLTKAIIAKASSSEILIIVCPFCRRNLRGGLLVSCFTKARYELHHLLPGVYTGAKGLARAIIDRHKVFDNKIFGKSGAPKVHRAAVRRGVVVADPPPLFRKLLPLYVRQLDLYSFLFGVVFAGFELGIAGFIQPIRYYFFYDLSSFRIWWVLYLHLSI